MATGSMILIKYLIILIVFASLWTCHDAVDMLKPGDTLNSTSSLFSASRKFSLSFVTRVINGHEKWFLAIRRVKDNPYQAWVANRDQPISISSSPVLTLDRNNTLKITHQGGVPYVLSSAPLINDTTTVVRATLLDTGNLILREADSSNGSTVRVFWQSFDYPKDTFLPGMKIGVNRSNGHTWSLSSWGVRHMPDFAGPFTLDWDTTEHQIKIGRAGILYWTSGVLSDGKFEFILPDKSKKLYNLSIVSNENEDYLTYTSLNDSSDPEPEWVLFSWGELLDYGAQLHIMDAENCDGYNIVGGCVRRNRTSDCIGKFGDGFESKTGYFRIIYSTTSRPANWIGNGTSDCKVTCWQDCDCLGFDFPSGNQTSTGAGCRFWSVDCAFIEDRNGTASFVLQSSAPAPVPPGRSIVYKWLWIADVIGAALMMLGASCYFLRRNCFPSGDLNSFTYASIRAATKNFSAENKLGQGGFGPVYKGTLKTGQEIAVKRLSQSSGQGMAEFRNELILIHQLHHTNLVQILGFCIHKAERMLIYEYITNKSLDYALFNPTTRLHLDWNKRFRIVVGVAQGLVYLHAESRPRVIHRDLKAGNILLDEDMNPKISDFGLARIFTLDELMEANTSKIVGTHGYMAPEYMHGGHFSPKSDVYSYGVVMLEIVSGRKFMSFYNEDRVLNFAGHAWELWKEDRGLELMDPILVEAPVNQDHEQVLRCIHIGLLCVEENAADRPTMADVILMLTDETVELPSPIKPAYYLFPEGNVSSQPSTYPLEL